MPKASSQKTTLQVDRFTICLPFILQQEMNDPDNWSDPKNLSHDPGPTFCGIEEPEFWEWLKQHGLPTVPVQQMTQSEGYAIYRANYWLPFCPHLPAGLDLLFFNSSVNQGPREATEILQVALGIQKDGIWGPQTAGAVAAIKNLPATILAFTARQQAVYKATPYKGEYSTQVHEDWYRRTAQISKTATAMAVPATQVA